MCQLIFLDRDNPMQWARIALDYHYLRGLIGTFEILKYNNSGSLYFLTDYDARYS